MLCCCSIFRQPFAVRLDCICNSRDNLPGGILLCVVLSSKAFPWRRPLAVAHTRWDLTRPRAMMPHIERVAEALATLLPGSTAHIGVCTLWRGICRRLIVPNECMRTLNSYARRYEAEGQQHGRQIYKARGVIRWTGSMHHGCSFLFLIDKIDSNDTAVPTIMLISCACLESDLTVLLTSGAVTGH